MYWLEVWIILEICFFCVEYSGGIELYSLIFDDKKGHWCFNLWYSEVRLGDPIYHCVNRKEVLEKCSDYFIMLSKTTEEQSPLENPVQHRTVICRSWRIRNKSGALQLPVPHRDVLHYKDWKVTVSTWIQLWLISSSTRLQPFSLSP